VTLPSRSRATFPLTDRAAVGLAVLITYAVGHVLALLVLP
jgi:hypothetical protein